MARKATRNPNDLNEPSRRDPRGFSFWFVLAYDSQAEREDTSLTAQFTATDFSTLRHNRFLGTMVPASRTKPRSVVPAMATRNQFLCDE